MKVWIIYNEETYLNRKENNDNNIAIEYSKAKHNIDLKIYKENNFSLTVEPKNIKLYYDDVLIEELPDFVLVRCQAENLKYYFEYKNISYSNKLTDCFKTSNKLATHIYLSDLGIKMPKTIFANSNSYDYDMISMKLGVPFVLKDQNGQKGTGVHLVDSEENFNSLVLMYNNNCLFQEYIKPEGSKGAHIRVTFVGNKLIDVKINRNDKDFRSNAYLGGVTHEYAPSDELIYISEKIHKASGLWTSGLDFIVTEDNEFYLIEINGIVPAYKDRENLATNRIIDIIAEQFHTKN